MDLFDQLLKERAKKEQPPLPEGYEDRLRHLCDSLQEEQEQPKRSKTVRWRTWIAAAAAAVFVIVPNVSVSVAYAMEEIPLIGNVVKVITLRNYFYQDEHHQASVKTPALQQAGNAGQEVNEEAEKYINDLLAVFKEECKEEGYQGLDVSYKVLMDTPEWFTLRVDVVKSAGGSQQLSRIYNIDKRRDELVTLAELFGENSNYKKLLQQEVEAQAAQRMKNDSADEYFTSEDFLIEEDHNFYWNQEGLLVLVFDEYTIAPGAMGSPEFVIPAEITSALQENA